MERGSAKHGPRLDEQLEHEDQDITRSGQPSHTQEWRDTEPFDGTPLGLPEDHQPGTAPGMTAADAERRSTIARFLPPHQLPADRGTLLDFLESSGAPDDVLDEVRRLPSGREFANAGEIARALGIPTEEDPDPESR